MSMQFPAIEALAAQQLVRGTVVALAADGSVEVVWAGGSALCDVLSTAAGPVQVVVNDCVLILTPSGEYDRGVLVGRIGTTSQLPETRVQAGEVPSELVIEATESLVLRVGEGSLTIRADGKILIKGKDLVSHAQRVNRIRGGSVAIN
jgi:hypothetical protein